MLLLPRLSGTPETIRTSDPSLRRRMLYPLSYWGICLCIVQCFFALVKRAAPVCHLRSAAHRRVFIAGFRLQRKPSTKPEAFEPAGICKKLLRLLPGKALKQFQFAAIELVLTEARLERQIPKARRAVPIYQVYIKIRYAASTQPHACYWSLSASRLSADSEAAAAKRRAQAAQKAQSTQHAAPQRQSSFSGASVCGSGSLCEGSGAAVSG